MSFDIYLSWHMTYCIVILFNSYFTLILNLRAFICNITSHNIEYQYSQVFAQPHLVDMIEEGLYYNVLLHFVYLSL